MVASSFAFWLVAYTTNDSDFMAMAFLSRFVFGLGSGLTRSVIMIARAQSKKGKKELQARDFFKWHMQAEAFGYFFGPLLIVITNHSRWENERTCMWLAIANAIIWFLFTICFVEKQPSALANESLNESRGLNVTSGAYSTSSRRESVHAQMHRHVNMSTSGVMRSGDFSQTDNFIKSLLYN